MQIAGLAQLVVGLLLVVAGLVTTLVARGSRDRVARVVVPGIVVGHRGFARPPAVVVRYPLPDGRPHEVTARLRVTRLSLNATGTELPVYVDPRNPYDAILVPGGSTQHQAAFVGGVLMAIGALFAVLGGALVAVALALPPG